MSVKSNGLVVYRADAEVEAAGNGIYHACMGLDMKYSANI